MIWKQNCLSSSGFMYVYCGCLRPNRTRDGKDLTLTPDGSNTVEYASAMIESIARVVSVALMNGGGGQESVVIGVGIRGGEEWEYYPGELDFERS